MLSSSGPLGNSSLSRVGEGLTRDHVSESDVAISEPVVLEEELVDTSSLLPCRLPR